MRFPKLGQFQLLASLTVVLALSGCGSGSSTAKEAQTSQALKYSIDETYNSFHCAYESPTYSTLEAYCDALQDTDLNQDHGLECGRDYRHMLFDQKCEGEFNPTLVIHHGNPGPRAE